MNNNDTKELEALMDQGKWTEARELIKQQLEMQPDGSMNAANKLKLASIYLKTKNRINRDYEAVLAEILEVLKKIKFTEQGVKDSIGAEEARQQIKDLKKGSA